MQSRLINQTDSLKNIGHTCCFKQPAAPKPPAEPEKTKAELLFQGQLNPKKKRRIWRLEQWIEVRVLNGETITKIVPSNEHLIRKGQKMWPPPEYVYRRFCFLDGVPDEYAWTCGMTPERRQTGGIGIQRILIDDWIEMMEAEKISKSPHLGPAPYGNLPRPRENGECDCLSCTTAYAILDKAEADEAGINFVP